MPHIPGPTDPERIRQIIQYLRELADRLQNIQ